MFEDHLRIVACFPETLHEDLFLYGWTTEYKVHWIVPLIGTVFVGYGLLIVFVSFSLSVLPREV